VFASCASVYRPTAGPKHETDLLYARTVQGHAKPIAEQLCLAYAIPADSTMSVIALRYFDVYGPRQNPLRLIPRLLAAAHTRGPVDVYGTSAQPRQYLYVLDAARAALAAATAPVQEAAVNIAGARPVTTTQLITLVRHVTRVTVGIAADYAQPFVAVEGTADLSEAARLLGFQPLVTLRAGLGRYSQWINSPASAAHWPQRFSLPSTGLYTSRPRDTPPSESC
jgi:nucleoside-diphosphate-sugar epimerase